MRVGFIGAGRMGAPMVKRLVDAGHGVEAVGRTDEKRRAVAELGASPVPDLLATAPDADAVILCVFTDDQVKELCLDGPLVERMQPGATLIVHTTGSPRTVQSIAARFPSIGVIDAPVSGGPHDIAAGRVTLFVGGDERTVDGAQPLLGSYGDPILHAGATGSGQLVKLVNNSLFAAQIGLVSEGVRLGARLGIEEGPLLSALTHGSAQSRVLSLIAGAGSADTFISAVGEFIGKDVAVVRDTVAELGGDLGAIDVLINAGNRA
jgi:3-hydroxyisobutyrate dehydrogenase-like beta-hydroxyacid dehydrogenase